MNKIILCIVALLSLMSVHAASVDIFEHSKLLAFVFFTGLIFACIPGALLKGFKLSLKYNILMGFVLSGVIYWLSLETYTSPSYSISLSIALLSGWLLSNYFLYKLLLQQFPKSSP